MTSFTYRRTRILQWERKKEMQTSGLEVNGQQKKGNKSHEGAQRRTKACTASCCEQGLKYLAKHLA